MRRFLLLLPVLFLVPACGESPEAAYYRCLAAQGTAGVMYGGNAWNYEEGQMLADEICGYTHPAESSSAVVK